MEINIGDTVLLNCRLGGYQNEKALVVNIDVYRKYPYRLALHDHKDYPATREEIRLLESKAIKYHETPTNETKLRPRNFPMWLLEDLFKVASMGEEKYGTYDYLQTNLTVNDHLDAAKRHLIKFEDPKQDDNDHESMVSHLHSVAWRCLVAAYVAENKPDLDDRFKGEKDA